jgi:phosphate-selective porin OprO and OprP
MTTRYFGRVTGVSAAALVAMSAGPALAQSNAELMAIIREQQRQIEELSRKVDALQGQAERASEEADAAAETAQQVEQAQDFEFDWEGPSPTIRSKDGNFEAHLRGRLFVDGGYLDDDDGFYDNDNATEARAARLGIEGTAWRDFGYRLEVDFADNEVDITDAYIDYDGEFIDPAYVRVGQFKTPNSLEELTSSRFITFMERAAFTDAFDFDRRIGLGSGVGGDNWAFNAGLFGQNADDVAANEGFAAAGRGHYAFVDPVGEDSAIHLGSSVRFRDLDNDADGDAFRYRQRPFFHFTDTRLVDTGELPEAENDVLLGGEAALVLGRFSLQGEAAHTWLQQDDADDASGLWGGYLSASYLLTDDSRAYEADDGVFDRVEVSDPVHEGGAGAWEVATRFDYLALNDGAADIAGGEMYSIIAGINWYPVKHVRFMLDYAFSRAFNASDSPGAAVDGSSNYVHGVGARAQVDF